MKNEINNHKVHKEGTKYTKPKPCIAVLCDLCVNLCDLCG